MTKEDVVKQIDGTFYYHSDYTDFLYKKLEIKDLILKALHKYFNDREQYEDNEFLNQLEICSENDITWLKRMSGEKVD